MSDVGGGGERHLFDRIHSHSSRPTMIKRMLHCPSLPLSPLLLGAVFSLSSPPTPPSIVLPPMLPYAARVCRVKTASIAKSGGDAGGGGEGGGRIVAAFD